MGEGCQGVIHQEALHRSDVSLNDIESLKNLAMLADRAVAAEKDVDEAKPGLLR